MKRKKAIVKAENDREEIGHVNEENLKTRPIIRNAREYT